MSKRNNKPAPEICLKNISKLSTTKRGGLFHLLRKRGSDIFAPQDIEYDRQCLRDYFFKEFLPDDDSHRGEDENAAREVMFNKLSELAEVIKSVKKKYRKQK
jgi:hypothetical protein